MVSYRTAPPDTNRISRDDQRWWQLSSLEFICRRLDAVENIQHETLIESRGHDLVWRRLLLEVQTQHAIELVVWRQRLIVKLSRRQFRRRTFVDDRMWNQLLVPVQVIRERITFGFQNVANHREPAVRIAVQSAIAEREFRFVAGRQQQTVFGVGDRHQNIPA